MVDTKKSEQFKRATSNLGINPEEEDLFISLSMFQMLNGIQKGGMAYPRKKLWSKCQRCCNGIGEEIASQSWRNGSWSNVYEYNEKFYYLDEVDMEEFEYPQDADKKANIGRNDFDEIDSQYVDSKYKHLI